VGHEEERVADNGANTKGKHGTDEPHDGRGVTQDDPVADKKGTGSSNMHVDQEDGEACNQGGRYEANKMVSFGANMSTEEDVSDGGSVEQ
jgi:hypothetical protein